MRVIVATAGASVATELRSPDDGVQLLSELAEISAGEIARYNLPPVYRAARYQREHVSPERWQSAAVTARRRYGDCEDLVAYRLGGIWLSGLDRYARPALVSRVPGSWHALVVRGDGMIEDPSAALGMTRRGLGVVVRKALGGYHARIDAPCGPQSNATAYGSGVLPLDAVVEAAVELAGGLESAGVPFAVTDCEDEVGGAPVLPLVASKDLALLIDVAEAYGSGRGGELMARLDAALREGASPAVVSLLRRAATVAGCG